MSNLTATWVCSGWLVSMEGWHFSQEKGERMEGGLERNGWGEGVEGEDRGRGNCDQAAKSFN